MIGQGDSLMLAGAKSGPRESALREAGAAPRQGKTERSEADSGLTEATASGSGFAAAMEALASESAPETAAPPMIAEAGPSPALEMGATRPVGAALPPPPELLSQATASEEATDLSDQRIAPARATPEEGATSAADIADLANAADVADVADLTAPGTAPASPRADAQPPAAPAPGAAPARSGPVVAEAPIPASTAAPETPSAPVDDAEPLAETAPRGAPKPTGAEAADLRPRTTQPSGASITPSPGAAGETRAAPTTLAIPGQPLAADAAAPARAAAAAESKVRAEADIEADIETPLPKRAGPESPRMPGVAPLPAAAERTSAVTEGTVAPAGFDVTGTPTEARAGLRAEAPHFATHLSPGSGVERVAAQVAGHIAVASKTAGDTLELRLDPPELGRVRLSFTITDAGVTALVSAERPDVLDFLRRHGDLLERELIAAGYRDVSLDFGQAGDGRGEAAERERADPRAAMKPEPETGPVRARWLTRAAGEDRLDIRI